MNNSQNDFLDNPFFSFIKPYIKFIDNGMFFKKPMQWLYILFAILNIIAPLIVIYYAGREGIFDMPAKYIFTFMIVWFIICFAGWISFQLWIHRSIQLKNITNESHEFVAIPVLAHFIQTSGEIFGTWIGVILLLISIVSIIFLGDSMYEITRLVGSDYFGDSIGVLISLPLIGFMIIILSRVFAESIKAITSIANNTKSTHGVHNSNTHVADSQNNMIENNITNNLKCSSCNHPYTYEDSFCENCGNKLK